MAASQGRWQFCSPSRPVLPLLYSILNHVKSIDHEEESKFLEKRARLTTSAYISQFFISKPQNLEYLKHLRDSGVSNLLASESHWKKKGCLGPHIKYTKTHDHKKKSHNVLSKFMILCWAAFTAILSCMWPVGRRLDTPAQISVLLIDQKLKHQSWGGHSLN